MKILSQRDPAWAEKRIGSSRLTVGRYGCALTSLINLANALGTNTRFFTPAGIAARAECFTQDGLIKWAEAGKLLGLKFMGTETGQNTQKILATIKAPRKGVVLQVNYGAHFVLGWSSSLFGGDIKVADPWDGKIVKAKAVYHNISGARYFEAA